MLLTQEQIDTAENARTTEAEVVRIARHVMGQIEDLAAGLFVLREAQVAAYEADMAHRKALGLTSIGSAEESFGAASRIGRNGPLAIRIVHALRMSLNISIPIQLVDEYPEIIHPNPYDIGSLSVNGKNRDARFMANATPFVIVAGEPWNTNDARIIPLPAWAKPDGAEYVTDLGPILAKIDPSTDPAGTRRAQGILTDAVRHTEKLIAERKRQAKAWFGEFIAEWATKHAASADYVVEFKPDIADAQAAPARPVDATPRPTEETAEEYAARWLANERTADSYVNTGPEVTSRVRDVNGNPVYDDVQYPLHHECGYGSVAGLGLPRFNRVVNVAFCMIVRSCAHEKKMTVYHNTEHDAIEIGACCDMCYCRAEEARRSPKL